MDNNAIISKKLKPVNRQMKKNHKKGRVCTLPNVVALIVVIITLSFELKRGGSRRSGL